MLKSGLYSAFDPRTVAACGLWLDSADRNTITLSGSNVTRWSDKSGNARHADASQNAFALWSNTSNGLRFSNSLYITGYTADSPSETSFLVFNYQGVGSGDGIVVGAYTNGRELLAFGGGAGLNKAGVTTYATTSFASNTLQILTCQYTTSSNSASINAGTPATGGATSFSSSNVTLLGRENATSFGFPGYMYELIMFPSVLSSSQIQQVEGYLAGKWGLGRTAPSTISLSAPSASLLFSPTMWFDATDATTIDLSGTSVTQWRDKSGNSNHTISVTGTVIYSSNAVNGRQGVYLNSSYFRGAVSITTSNVQAFAVATLESNASNFAYLLALSSNAGADSWNNGASVSPFGRDGTTTTLRTIRNANSAFGPNAITYGVPFLVGSCNVPGVGNINTNAQAYGAVGNGATGAFGITAFALGSDTNTGAGQFWRGHISEVLVYDKVLTTDQKYFVENYLMQKWNVTSLIPLTHPYRTALPLMRPFNPLDISGCVLWVDAADPTTMTLSGSNVTQWRDKSGRGYVFNNLPGQSSPSLTNTFNGTRPCVESTTTSMIMGTAYDVSTTSIHGPQGLSYFLVQRFGSGTVAVQYERNGVAGTRILNHETSNWLTYYGPSYGNAGVQTTTPCVMSTVVNLPTSNLFGYMNGSNVVTASGVSIQNLSCNAGWGLFGLNDTANGGMFGSVTKIAEFIQYSVPLTDAQRQQVEAYLVAKWGLLGTTPSNHPARLAPALTPQFSPLLVGNCTLWLDAADQSTLTLSGSNVTRWNDKSGAGGNGTATNTPVLSRAVFGGRQSILFASNAYFSGATANTGTTLSCFAVVQLTTIATPTGNNMRVLSLGTPSNYDYDSVGRIAAINVNYSTVPDTFGVYRSSGQWASATSGVSSNTPYIVSSILNGSVATSHLNGTLGPRSLATTGTFAITSYAVGNQTLPTTEFLRGYLGEVLLFTSALTTTQRQQVEGYLARKWGLLTSLPSNHPYRVTPLF
jgi:hypothetical protein